MSLLELVREAAHLVETGEHIFSCNALVTSVHKSLGHSLLSEHTSWDLRHKYETFTLQKGTPTWWGVDDENFKSERIQALNNFADYLETQNAHQL